jgi:hypothetical protein
MILDDVFVNSDAGRTRTACAVLRDFARQGHQLLVFTCHEHVWRMFQELKVDTRRIPNRHGEPEEVINEPQPEPPPARPRPQPAEPEPIPPKVSEFIPDPEPVPVEAPPILAVEPDIEYYEDAPEPELIPAPALAEVEYHWDWVASPSFQSRDGARPSAV